MTSESGRTEPRSGDLDRCLLRGSAEDEARGRSSKRRALLISLAVESAALGALVILPLLAKPAEFLVRGSVPIPPYRTHRPARRSPDPEPPRRRTGWSTASPFLPLAPVAPTKDRPAEGGELDGLPAIESVPSVADSLIGGIPEARPEPVRPAEPHRQPRIREARIDPALLLNRVEPVYPPLARQIRRSGRVELHAIISSDGSVLSLEVVSGDPLFVASALDAVRQWRYKPTYLDGQPVEIDTFITVIYMLDRE